MTAAVDEGPSNSSIDEESRRWYDHPVTGERFMSVTTALKGVAKDALVPWAAGLSAALAVDEVPRIIKATLVDPCGYTHVPDKRCKDCIECVVRWIQWEHHRANKVATNRGTRVHRALQLWAQSGNEPPLDPDIVDYFKSFMQFVADFGLNPRSFEVTECTVLDRVHQVAGTLDAVLRIKPVTKKAAELCARVCRHLGVPLREILVVFDAKSREKEKAAFYQDMALQLAGYRNAQMIMLPNGQEWPLPATDGGLVVQFRPNGYGFRFTAAGPAEHKAFVDYMSGYRWTIEHGNKALQVQTFPLPSDWEWKPPQPPEAPPATAANIPSVAAGPPKKATPPKARSTARKAAPVATRAPVGSSARASVVGTTAGNQLKDEDIPF